MVPERNEFLKQFDIFYKGLVKDIKQEKITEADFYMIIKAKVKAMDRERREEVVIKVSYID